MRELETLITTHLKFQIHPFQTKVLYTKHYEAYLNKIGESLFNTISQNNYLSYDEWQKIMMEQNRIFDEAIKRQGRMFEDAIKQYSDSNARMFEDAIKQYSDSNARMFEDAIRRQLHIFDESVKRQQQVIDNTFKQFSERSAKIFNVTTKKVSKKGQQNVRKKKR